MFVPFMAFDILQKFLSLTKRTYPHNTERDIYHLLPQEIQIDFFGNAYLEVGNTEDYDTMFCAHLDTYYSGLNIPKMVTHRIEGDLVTAEDSILGADDKAGVVILLYMIEHKVSGLYYFFIGEEKGRIGSKKVATVWRDKRPKHIQKVVAFDRKGRRSVINKQSGLWTCSSVFARALVKELNTVEPTFDYKTDDGGISCDSLSFEKIIPECTNISVGYEYCHTVNEKQDIAHLRKLAEACIKVRWKELPVGRKLRIG